MAVPIAEIRNQTLSGTEFESRLQLSVEGLNQYFYKLLSELPSRNSVCVTDYVINELKRENNASINYVRMNIYAIVDLIKYCKKLT